MSLTQDTVYAVFTSQLPSEPISYQDAFKTREEAERRLRQFNRGFIRTHLDLGVPLDLFAQLFEIRGKFVELAIATSEARKAYHVGTGSKKADDMAWRAFIQNSDEAYEEFCKLSRHFGIQHG
jgi:hypothetical protein